MQAVIISFCAFLLKNPQAARALDEMKEGSRPDEEAARANSRGKTLVTCVLQIAGNALRGLTDTFIRDLWRLM
jgi:hypothetical protein